MKIKRLSEYGKYRKFISSIIRNKKYFINHKRIKDKTYLNVGCGPKPIDNFINLDYYWRPFVDICWDLEKEKSLHTFEGFTEFKSINLFPGSRYFASGGATVADSTVRLWNCINGEQIRQCNLELALKH